MTNGDNLGIRVDVPKGLQGIIVFATAAFSVAVAIGLAALFFRSIREEPFGGLWTNNWPTVSAVLGFVSGLFVTAWRALMKKLDENKEATLLEVRALSTAVLTHQGEDSDRFQAQGSRISTLEGSVAILVSLYAAHERGGSN